MDIKHCLNIGAVQARQPTPKKLLAMIGLATDASGAVKLAGDLLSLQIIIAKVPESAEDTVADWNCQEDLPKFAKKNANFYTAQVTQWMPWERKA